MIGSLPSGFNAQANKSPDPNFEDEFAARMVEEQNSQYRNKKMFELLAKMKAQMENADGSQEEGWQALSDSMVGINANQTTSMTPDQLKNYGNPMWDQLHFGKLPQQAGPKRNTLMNLRRMP